MKSKRGNIRLIPKAIPQKIFLDQSRCRKSQDSLEIANPVMRISFYVDSPRGFSRTEFSPSTEKIVDEQQLQFNGEDPEELRSTLRVRSFGVIWNRVSDPRSVWIMVRQRNR